MTGFMGTDAARGIKEACKVLLKNKIERSNKPYYSRKSVSDCVTLCRISSSWLTGASDYVLYAAVKDFVDRKRLWEDDHAGPDRFQLMEEYLEKIIAIANVYN